ncbi:peptidoglycan/LPS O-acetylase OafA/YrhL [Saccharothrix coeruleofusca]|uniref:acyltransferase family protein n=1 Tax=Saccharothrix coeruleofusca TaxID=33919 RepID=UPI001AE8D0E4|nr:acyltransferase family protein [Saccharothrix coeruleofusca]MBP2340139.1 peptidoglycan/LPS O-acetylase OafA/YrhL [Saccharothrix coeruleofusca]
MALVDTVRPTRPAARGRTPHRHDIQGLRALAVGLVLVYHLRPEWLPGGFVGVDAFFVLSGYLIIGALTAELRRTGTLNLVDFYARRIRRLLPAATAVLLAVVAATAVLLPVGRRPGVLREVVASALNVQNWQLALFSADYANATASASPVQHFWSLAVEEQFYLVIPLLLLAGAAVAGKRGGRVVPSAFVAVLLLTAASLALSAVVTPDHHVAAYFATPTRMWELGIGGLTAMAAHRLHFGPAVRLLLGWAGLLALLVSAVKFRTDLPFPGWIALLPTVGTAALLLGGLGARPVPGEVSPLLGLRPLRYLGDISYSLYLWHWPVIVFLLEAAGTDRLTDAQLVFAGALSLALAALSKRFVEDPFRARRPASRLRKTYLLGVALVVVTTASACVPWHSAQTRLDDLTSAAVLDAAHPGALAMDPAVGAPTGVPAIPDPAVAAKDIASVWADGCGQYDPARHPVSGDTCAYGAPNATRTMVVVGDSHMTQFATALIDIAEDAGWRVKLMVHDGCPFSAAAPVMSPRPDPAHQVAPFAECQGQDDAKLAAILADKPDLVVTAAMSPESYENDLNWVWPSRQQLVDGYRARLAPITQAGIPVAVIRDTPRADDNVLDCLQRNPAPGSCDKPRAKAVDAFTDPLADTAATLPGARVVDLTDWICRPDTCPAVVGNVVVYRDNHLTDTYVRTLTAPLRAALAL